MTTRPAACFARATGALFANVQHASMPLSCPSPPSVDDSVTHLGIAVMLIKKNCTSKSYKNNRISGNIKKFVRRHIPGR
jgi:hypothetical protein